MNDPFADIVADSSGDPFADIIANHTPSVPMSAIQDKSTLPSMWNPVIKGNRVSAVYNEDAGGFVVPSDNGLSLVVRRPTGELDLSPVTEKTIYQNKLKNISQSVQNAVTQGLQKTVGAVTRGVLGLPVAAMQLGASGYNAIAPESAQIPQKDMPANAFEYNVNRMYGEPDIASKAAEGAVSMMTGSAAAKGASNILSKGGQAPTTLSRVVGELGAGSQTQQAITGAGAAAAEEKAREAGYGQTGQLTSSVLGGLAGTFPQSMSNIAKLALRGKESNIPDMKIRRSVLESGTGMTPTVGQVTAGRMIPTKIEAVAARIPGIGDKMRIKGEEQLKAPTQKAIQLADDLSKTKDAQQAGALIDKSIKGEFNPDKPLSFNQHVSKNFKLLQDETAKYVKPDDEVPVVKTLSTLKSLTTPTKGAIETSSGVINPKLVAIMKDFESDLGLTQKKADFPKERVSVTNPQTKQTFDYSQGAKTEVVPGTTKTSITGTTERNVLGPEPKTGLPYSTLRSLRTQIGNLASTPEVISGVPKGELMKVYRAISEDIRTSLVAKYGEKSSAVQAFDRENKYWSAVKARQDAALDSTIAKQTPEEMFRYATDPKYMKDGSTRIAAVMRSIKDPATRDAVSAVFLRKIAGKDLADFAKTWQSIHPRAKLVMFPGLSRENIKMLDDAAASNAMINKAEDTGMILHKTGDVGIRSKRLLNWLQAPTSATDDQIRIGLMSALFDSTHQRTEAKRGE